MLGLMGFSGSLPLYVVHRCYIFFVDRANKDACLLTMAPYKNLSTRGIWGINRSHFLFLAPFITDRATKLIFGTLGVYVCTRAPCKKLSARGILETSSPHFLLLGPP